MASYDVASNVCQALGFGGNGPRYVQFRDKAHVVRPGQILLATSLDAM